MKESALWLANRGMPLWDTEDLTVTNVLPKDIQSEVFIARINGEPAGTVVLQDEDKLFWPEIEDSSSLFFHKLAVKRKFAGIGVSKALIDHSYEVAKSRNKNYLRMDSCAQHPKLRTFYESHGFQFVDQRQVSRWLVDRLEKLIL